MIFNPAHPGEVLRDYLGEMSVGEAAYRLGITRAHLSRILNGHAGIAAKTSLRLSAALGTSPDFWLKMQMQQTSGWSSSGLRASKSFHFGATRLVRRGKAPGLAMMPL
jgi:addiction module HigA family antidote